jgi:ABC-type nitrate/sulfonate/bicarbonate transport system ATPase subunit
VLTGLDLTMYRGEFVAIIGHSGVDKPSLLRILAGLDDAFRGDVVIARQLSVMFQDCSAPAMAAGRSERHTRPATE